MSIRGDEWRKFARRVLVHVEGYTVTQYGDYPNDKATPWTADRCMEELDKYRARYGKGMRGDEEQERDFCKMAHCICMAWHKWRGER